VERGVLAQREPEVLDGGGERALEALDDQSNDAIVFRGGANLGAAAYDTGSRG
jgi:hypothetical protein